MGDMLSITEISEKVKQKLYLKFGMNNDFWRVLEVDEKNNAMLIIAEQCVGRKKFDDGRKTSTWDNSYIRRWLNTGFYNSYFSHEEQDLILETELIAKDNIEERTSGGKNTTDKVFLLDIDQAKQLFKNDEDMFCAETWWLRSSGRVPYCGSSYAATVSEYSGISKSGSIVYEECGVRPVVRIKYDLRYPYEFKGNNEIKCEDCLIIQHNKVIGTRYAIEKMQIPEGIEEIESSSFSGKRQLKEISLPSSLKKIGNKAFNDCRSLKEIIIPGSVTAIGSDAFSKCYSLEKVVIQEGVKKIGDFAFFGCESLKEITIPSSVTAIKYAAFEGCKSLEKVVIPGGVKKIESVAFSGCWKLKINLSKKLSIDSDSFDYVDEVTMKDGSLPIWKAKDIKFKFDKPPFYNSKIKILGNDDEFGLILIDYDGDESLAIIDKISKAISNTEGYFDFKNYDDLFDIAKKIPTKATIATFRYLYPYKLADETKTKYEKWIKRQSEKVGRFCIDRKNTMIFKELLEKDIFDPKVLNNLKAYAKNCNMSDIADLIVCSNNLEDESSNIIERSDKLDAWLNNYIKSRKLKVDDRDSFVVENGVLKEFIGESKMAIVPKGVKTIGKHAFHNKKKLKAVILQDGVTEIEKDAFSGCESLEILIIPNSVKNGSTDIFSYCSSLKLLVLPPIFAKDIANNLLGAYRTSNRHETQRKLEMLILPNAIHSDFDCHFSSEITTMCKRSSALGFMLAKELYKNNVDYEKYRRYALSQRKNLLQTIYRYDLVEALEFYDSEKKITSKTIEDYTYYANLANAKKCTQYLNDWKERNLNNNTGDQKTLSIENEETLKLIGEKSLKTVEIFFLEKFMFKINDLPEIIKKDGTQASKYLLAALLYKDINEVEYDVYYGWLDRNCRQVINFSFDHGETAKRILEVIDEDSMQSSFVELANMLSKLSKHTKKFDILRAISFYANEKTMKRILQIGDGYAINQDYLNDYWCFNSTKAAILHADKKKYMKKYASLRGYDEDQFREKYLFECGLDQNGCIVFDLGDRTITAKLQSNYTFALSDNTGKQLTSFPRSASDEIVLNSAKEKYNETKQVVDAIRKNLKKQRMDDYLTGKSIDAQKWKDSYLVEPLHKIFASTLVWSQNHKTFTISNNTLVCADGSVYLMDEKEKITVAHVMEMQQNEIEEWQRYFLQNHIIQPFEQIWELPISFNSVLPGRYEGITLKQNILMGKYSHGIIYHKPIDRLGEGPKLEFKNNSLKMNIIEDTERKDYISLGKLNVVKKDRIANHVIHLLDKWTVFGRIAKDDISVMSYMDQYNASQITEFIEIAVKNKANNLIAALLEYKNNRYPEYDEFTCFEIDII